MATLSVLAVRSACRNRCKLAPKASQMKQLGKSSKDEEQTKAHRLGECVACFRVQVGTDPSKADEPRLGVDPL